METEPVIVNTVLKPKRKYTKHEGQVYGRPKKAEKKGDVAGQDVIVATL